MRDKRLGPILLSGLIIGPILGSGIILLPPLIYETTGDYAILAWIVMMGIGFLFASLFGKLSIRYPNESGVAHAADQEILGIVFCCFFGLWSVGKSSATTAWMSKTEEKRYLKRLP
jgi:amino acid transporter